MTPPRERLALVCGYYGSGCKDDPVPLEDDKLSLIQAEEVNFTVDTPIIIPKPANRAGCVVFNRAGHVLLVKGLASTSQCCFFPKGHIEYKEGKPEDLVDTALREVQEETGVQLDYTTMPFLCYYEYAYKGEKIKCAFFSAQATHKVGVGDHDSFFCPIEKAKEILFGDLIPVLEIALGEREAGKQ